MIKLTDAEKKERKRICNKRYRSSDKYKKDVKLYRQTEKYKKVAQIAAKKRYLKSIGGSYKVITRKSVKELNNNKNLRSKQNRDNLTDTYLKGLLLWKDKLCVHNTYIPQEIIDLKRKQIILTRKIKQHVSKEKTN